MAISNILSALIALFFYYQGDWKKQIIREPGKNIEPISIIPEEG